MTTSSSDADILYGCPQTSRQRRRQWQHEPATGTHVARNNHGLLCWLDCGRLRPPDPWMHYCSLCALIVYYSRFAIELANRPDRGLSICLSVRLHDYVRDLRPRFRHLSFIKLCLGRWKFGRMGKAACQQWRNAQVFVNK